MIAPRGIMEPIMKYAKNVKDVKLVKYKQLNVRNALKDYFYTVILNAIRSAQGHTMELMGYVNNVNYFVLLVTKQNPIVLGVRNMEKMITFWIK